jgi:hypothetical protein
MTIEFEFFDPNYWMFNLGLTLERYEEYDKTHYWIRRRFIIGLLIFSINFDWNVNKRKIGDT